MAREAAFRGKMPFRVTSLAESDANAVSSLRQSPFQAISLPWELETSSVFFLVFSPHFYVLLCIFQGCLYMFCFLLFLTWFVLSLYGLLFKMPNVFLG